MLNPPLIPCQHRSGNLQLTPGSSQYSMIRQMQEHFSYAGSPLLRVQSSHREYQPWLTESSTTAIPQNRYLPQTQCIINSTTNPGHLCFPGSATHELSSNTETELRKLSFSTTFDNHSLHNASTHPCIPHSQMHMPIDIGTHFVSPSTISVAPIAGLPISTSARNLQTELTNASRRIYQQPSAGESPELSLWRIHSHRYHPYSHLSSQSVIGQQPVSNFMPHVLSQTHPPASPFPRGTNCDFVPRFPATSSAHHAALLALGDRLASSSSITRRCARCRCPNCLSPTDLRNANGKKEHICHFPNCGKVYGKTSHLKAHIRWHLGERPFVCNWLFCGKSFTRSDELQRHLRTHTGEKKFQCQICEKKFMRSDHLSKHVKIHKKKSSSPTISDHEKSKSESDKQSSPVKENETK